MKHIMLTLALAFGAILWAGQAYALTERPDDSSLSSSAASLSAPLPSPGRLAGPDRAPQIPAVLDGGKPDPAVIPSLRHGPKKDSSLEDLLKVRLPYPCRGRPFPEAYAFIVKSLTVFNK